MSQYPAVYAAWQSDPVGFWEEAGKQIDWFTPATSVFNADSGVYGRWFDGAVCNTCYNCVDRHVDAGHGDRMAVIYGSPVTGTVQRFTYAELKDQVSALAAVMRGLGVTKGDRVVIYMPMVPQAIFAMLACARLGAVHSVVFGGFAPQELATRIDDAAPKAIISASCGIEPGRVIAYKPLLDEAIELLTGKPDACIILQRDTLTCELTSGRDHDYATAVATAMAQGDGIECVPVAATDPLYIFIRRERRGSRQALCAITAGIWLR